MQREIVRVRLVLIVLLALLCAGCGEGVITVTSTGAQPTQQAKPGAVAQVDAPKTAEEKASVALPTPPGKAGSALAQPPVAPNAAEKAQVAPQSSGKGPLPRASSGQFEITPGSWSRSYAQTCQGLNASLNELTEEEIAWYAYGQLGDDKMTVEELLGIHPDTMAGVRFCPSSAQQVIADGIELAKQCLENSGSFNSWCEQGKSKLEAKWCNVDFAKNSTATRPKGPWGANDQLSCQRLATEFVPNILAAIKDDPNLRATFKTLITY